MYSYVFLQVQYNQPIVNISPRCCTNFEANSSEFLENRKALFIYCHAQMTLYEYCQDNHPSIKGCN